ncbi:hypothetical protein Scep_003340 [Stephania cephalantha]|uniref:Uncharacterized protein n=1 Tax=Stephania cephalantha TaxID=152367 RepID=A0AAP0KQF9_9MAGN
MDTSNPAAVTPISSLAAPSLFSHSSLPSPLSTALAAHSPSPLSSARITAAAESRSPPSLPVVPGPQLPRRSDLIVAAVHTKPAAAAVATAARRRCRRCTPPSSRQTWRPPAVHGQATSKQDQVSGDEGCRAGTRETYDNVNGELHREKHIGLQCNPSTVQIWWPRQKRKIRKLGWGRRIGEMAREVVGLWLA